MSDQQGSRRHLPGGDWSGNQRAWLTAVLLATALTLPSELGRRHYAGHTLGARIIGGVLFATVLALVFRALIYALVPKWRRRDAGRTGGAPAPRGLPAEGRAWGPLYAFGALIGVFVALAAVGFALQGLKVVSLPLGVGTLIVEGAFLLTLLPLNRRYGVHASDLGLRRTSGPRGVALVIGGSVAVAALAGIYAAAVRPARASGSLEGLGHHSALAIAVACFASIVAAPVGEEIFFRGLLYGGLRNRLPVVPAALIVAAVFGLLHTQYPLLVRPELAILGLVACLLYERTRSLLPSMGMHSLHNALAMTIALGVPLGIPLAAYAVLGLGVSAPAASRAVRRRVRRSSAPVAGAQA